MKIAFYCDLKLQNYKTAPEQYIYLHGRHSATGYYYWILKNNGIKNIYLINDTSKIDQYDAVVFHYDNKSIIENYKGIKIQVVTDRPVVEGCDLYIAANQSFNKKINDLYVIQNYGIENTLNTWIYDKEKWHFIHYTPTFGVKQCKAQHPPITFKYVGRIHTNVDGVMAEDFKKKCADKKINLVFDFSTDANSGDEDVYFAIRKIQNKSQSTGFNNNSGKFGHRTPNRLYQGWFMRTPCIFNNSPEMSVIRDNEYDFLIANDENEFLEQALRLKSDKKLFKSMIDNGISKDSINPYVDLNIIVNQWKEAFTKLNLS